MKNMNIRTRSASGTTLASVALEGRAAEVPIVVSFSVTSDKAGSVISVKEPDGKSNTVGTIAASGQKVVLCDITGDGGYAQNDIIVAVRPNGTVERMVVDTIQNDTSLTMVANIVVALPVGTVLYRVAQTYSFPVGAATVTQVGDGPFGYFCGNQPAMPMLVELDGTSACAINFLTAVYGK